MEEFQGKIAFGYGVATDFCCHLDLGKRDQKWSKDIRDVQYVQERAWARLKLQLRPLLYGALKRCPEDKSLPI